MITILAVGGDAPLELVGGKAPREVRLFRRGANPSTKATYLFDDEARRAVMARYDQMGRGWISIDYDHGSLQQNPVDPSLSSKSAGRARIEDRDGELWAVDIRWTPAARASVEAGEWPSISPAFQHDEQGRPVWLINFGLTGNPALYSPVDLVAANVVETSDEPRFRALRGEVDIQEDSGGANELAPAAAAESPRPASAAALTAAPATEPITQGSQAPTARGRSPQRTITMMNRLGRMLAANGKTAQDLAAMLGCSEDEATGLMTESAEMGADKTLMSAVALSVGLTGNAGQQELVQRISQLGAIERHVRALPGVTGTASVSEVLGTLSALADQAKEVPTLRAQLATVAEREKTARVEALLNTAREEKRITPAQVESLRAAGLQNPDWLDAYLKACSQITALSTVHQQPPAPPAGLHAPPAGGAVAQLSTDPATGAVTYMGKTYEQLDRAVLHDLRVDPATKDIYKALADDCARRNPHRAKDFSHLSRPDIARL